MRIAVVEDEDDIARFFEDLFAAAGHDVVRVDQHDITPIGDTDALIVDLMMPDVSGFQVLEQVTRQFPHVRKIVVSAKYQEPADVAELAALADVVLTKPVDGEQLLGALA